MLSNKREWDPGRVADVVNLSLVSIVYLCSIVVQSKVFFLLASLGSCVRFFCYNISFLRIMRQRFPSVSALEFRWRREIPSVNQKLTFDERIGCITRHDDFSPRSHRAVSLQVVPFLRDCTGRGYRSDRRAGQTERKTSEFIVIWFKFISNRDFNREKPLEFKCSIDLCIPRISEFDSWTQRKHTHQNNSDRAKSHYVIMWLTIKKSMSTKGGGGPYSFNCYGPPWSHWLLGV